MSIVLASIAVASGMMVQQQYLTESLKWRADREAALKKPQGWLSVAGLFWLAEGNNTVGTSAGTKVVLPASSGAPSGTGVITMTGKKISIKPSTGADIKVNGKSITDAVMLKSDADGSPDMVQIGSVFFMIIVRGKRTGVRLFDAKSISMKEFSGCHWYPVNNAFRVKAKFVPYSPPKKANIMNVLGDVDVVSLPGYVEFTIDGKACRLDAQDEGDTLFFNFKDMTSGTITYPPGRFLNVPKPVDGVVDLDFNKAVNPPCAFTAFATCPLPPKSNILNVRISAGELNHHPAH